MILTTNVSLFSTGLHKMKLFIKLNFIGLWEAVQSGSYLHTLYWLKLGNVNDKLNPNNIFLVKSTLCLSLVVSQIALQ